MGGLEPGLRKSGTRKFLGGSDHSPKIIKWQGMKLLTFFVACLCQLGGTEIRCKEETGSQNAGFVTLVHSVATRWTNGFLLMLQMFWKIIQLWIQRNQHWVDSRACYIKRFRRTLGNLLYEKGLPTTGGPATKGILWPAKITSSTFFWQQKLLLTVSKTVKGKLIWIAGPKKPPIKENLVISNHKITLQLIDIGKIFSYN